MGTVNLVLDAEDEEKVRALRNRGVEISDFLLQAIRSEYDKGRERAEPRDVERVLREIYEQFPDDEAPRPSVNPHDRRAVQAFIAAKLRGEARP